MPYVFKAASRLLRPGKQVCNYPAQFRGENSTIFGRSGKLARLTEMLEEALAAGDRALVFSQFAEMGTILKRHLEDTFGHETLFLHGAVPKRAHDRMVERFQADGDGPPLFVLSLKAGGTGSECSHGPASGAAGSCRGLISSRSPSPPRRCCGR